MCERYNRHNSEFASCTSGKKVWRPLKKVIPSKPLDSNSSDVKSCSTSVINYAKKHQSSKPKKITTSDIHFTSKRSTVDFCGCGDASNVKKPLPRKSLESLQNPCVDIETQVSIDKERSKKSACNKNKLVQQYYKNENFKRSGSSVKSNNLKNVKTNLDPIKECIKAHSKDSSESILEVYSDSVEEIGFLDLEDDKKIEDLKDFRKKNYFECHSAKSRISSKGSVTSLSDHKCVYRFYLNDRLFPVPLHTDHRNTIRCIECHLPLEDTTDQEDSINGTVQAKVKIGDCVQDMVLMLPVRKPLMVKERRKLKDQKEDSVLYFGIIKLSYDGDSMFKRNLPGDSLALRYQKGFKEFVDNDKYRYEQVKENDVIII